jgi:hypothetical protein
MVVSCGLIGQGEDVRLARVVLTLHASDDVVAGGDDVNAF